MNWSNLPIRWKCFRLSISGIVCGVYDALLTNTAVLLSFSADDERDQTLENNDNSLRSSRVKVMLIAADLTDATVDCFPLEHAADA